MESVRSVIWLYPPKNSQVFLSLLQTGSKKMEHKGNSWHENCFTCNRCQQPIGTRSFVQKDSHNYCLPCYEKQYAQKCFYCKMVRERSVKMHAKLTVGNTSDEPTTAARPPFPPVTWDKGFSGVGMFSKTQQTVRLAGDSLTGPSFCG